MKTKIEHERNKCRLIIEDMHTHWFEDTRTLYDSIDTDGLDLYKSQALEHSNDELSQKTGILRLSQSTGQFQITLL